MRVESPSCSCGRSCRTSTSLASSFVTPSSSRGWAKADAGPAGSAASVQSVGLREVVKCGHCLGEAEKGVLLVSGIQQPASSSRDVISTSSSSCSMSDDGVAMEQPHELFLRSQQQQQQGGRKGVAEDAAASRAVAKAEPGWHRHVQTQMQQLAWKWGEAAADQRQAQALRRLRIGDTCKAGVEHETSLAGAAGQPKQPHHHLLHVAGGPGRAGVRLSFASISLSAVDEQRLLFGAGGAAAVGSANLATAAGDAVVAAAHAGDSAASEGELVGAARQDEQQQEQQQQEGGGLGGVMRARVAGTLRQWRHTAGEGLQGLAQRLPLEAFVDVLPAVPRVRLPMFRLPFFGDDDADAMVSAVNHVYAGTMARTLSQVVCHPVDTVKTRMQIKDPPKKLRKWRRKVTKKAIGFGPVDIDNYAFKGPGDLFRGVWGAILGTIPNAMLYFFAYESTKKRLENELPAGLVHIASASVGTIAASIVRVPADTLKHRVQAYMHKNVFEALKVVVQTEGIRGLYRGFWPTLMRDVPEIAIQFSLYENLRAFVREKRGVEKLTTPEHLMLGAFAGAVAATCTMPLDLVKTRQQCGMSEGIHRIVMNVMAESGPAGLLAGLGPRAFHVSLMSAVFFGLFEYCKLVMKPDRTAADRLTLPKIFNKRRDHIWKRQFVYTG